MTAQNQRIIDAAVAKAWAPREREHRAAVAELKKKIAELRGEDHELSS
jgi:hypothetical protein